MTTKAETEIHRDAHESAGSVGNPAFLQPRWAAKDTMRKIGLTLLILAGIASIAAGIRYLLADEFMPYHAIVAGKAWSQIEPGTQTIVLGMLKILGGGFLSCGVALLWLFVPLRRDEAWARWAALSVAAAVWIPTQYVTLVLKSAAPNAQPPIIPTAAILVLVVAAVVVLFAANTASPNDPI